VRAFKCFNPKCLFLLLASDEKQESRETKVCRECGGPLRETTALVHVHGNGRGDPLRSMMFVVVGKRARERRAS
jgi:hypothetical protein